MLVQIIGLILMLSVLTAVLLLALLRLFSRPPLHLGVRAGRLAPCPRSPNCVCSQDSDPGHRIDPIALSKDGKQTWDRLRQILVRWPRTRIVTETDRYLHAECTSWLFRYVDDVEFLLDHEARVIQVRSASRVGRSDLGINRRRIEAIRQALATAPSEPPIQ
jgi:uncharacterized protein (DUF1499 family)